MGAGVELVRHEFPGADADVIEDAVFVVWHGGENTRGRGWGLRVRLGAGV